MRFAGPLTLRTLGLLCCPTSIRQEPTLKGSQFCLTVDEINYYGCTPLRLPADFDFINLFHGVDERVPVGSLVFGAKVVDHILQEA